jgi:hypothetical protein
MSALGKHVMAPPPQDLGLFALGIAPDMVAASPCSQRCVQTRYRARVS